MTIETLNRANEIEQEIRHLTRELYSIERIEKEMENGKNDLIRISDSTNSCEFFDLDTKKEIVRIAKNGIQNKIKKLKQEFEEL